MKKTAPSFLIALVAVFALAGVAVAQQDMGNASTTGATFTVGVVESFGTDSVTIKKDTGDVVTVLLEDATVGKANLANGTRVRIDYADNDKGQPIAKVIEINAGNKVAEAAPAIEAPKVEVESTVAVETPAPAPAAPAPAVEAAPAAEPAPEMAATTETTPEALPSTASRLPAFALLGLLALAGGVAVRMTR